MKNITPKYKNQFTIFDWVKNIIDYKKSWSSFNSDEHKIFNGFMIHKILSMNPKYLDIVNYIQKLNIKDNKKLYELYCFIIPQSKNTYSPYIKSKNKKYKPEVPQYIAQYFECSIKEAEEYIKLTNQNWVESILSSMGLDKDQIKKLSK